MLRTAADYGIIYLGYLLQAAQESPKTFCVRHFTRPVSSAVFACLSVLFYNYYCPAGSPLELDFPPITLSPLAKIHGRKEGQKHQPQTSEGHDVGHAQAKGGPDGPAAPIDPEERDTGNIKNNRAQSRKHKHRPGCRNISTKSLSNPFPCRGGSRPNYTGVPVWSHAETSHKLILFRCLLQRPT